jgi:hypothetical protein
MALRHFQHFANFNTAPFPALRRRQRGDAP